MTLASRTNRLVAQFLDALIAFTPSIVAWSAFAFGFKTGALVYLIALLWSPYYLLMADGMHDGRSYAKQWLGMRVVDRATGAPCSFGQSFGRNILLMLLGPIDWIFIFGDSRQRLGDKLAGTSVIQV